MGKVVHVVFDKLEDCPYFGMEDDRTAFCNHPTVCNSMGENGWCLKCPLPTTDAVEGANLQATNCQSVGETPQICPHYVEATDGVHHVVIGRCNCSGKLHT
jgi:hypothetical protein